MEQFEYNMLFPWSAGLSIDPVKSIGSGMAMQMLGEPARATLTLAALQGLLASLERDSSRVPLGHGRRSDGRADLPLSGGTILDSLNGQKAREIQKHLPEKWGENPPPVPLRERSPTA